MHRATIRYEGRVQGVGFRATVFDLTGGHEVVGQVRNMVDGSVELIVEGDEATLLSLHQAVLDRMARNVVSHSISWEEIEEPTFERFSIAHTGYR